MSLQTTKQPTAANAIQRMVIELCEIREPSSSERFNVRLMYYDYEWNTQISNFTSLGSAEMDILYDFANRADLFDVSVYSEDGSEIINISKDDYGVWHAFDKNNPDGYELFQ